MDRVLEREGELAQLEGALARAQEGRGALILIGGEAGAGKTALVRAFEERVGDAAAVWQSHCEPLSMPIPLAPIRELAAAAQVPDEPDALALARALRDRVEEAAAIAVLEDLQWADAASLDVLRLMAGWVERASVVAIATYRDDELEANHDLGLLVGDLVTHPAVTRIKVPPLSAAAVEELAQQSGVDVPELFGLTGGNPLLVVESIAAGGGVPATVRDATLARTRRLEPAARRLLGAAAVIGQDVPLGLLREVADADADAIEECISHGVLVDEGAMLRFRHELIRQAVEEGTSTARKQDLHARVLEALKERGAPAGRLAHHAEQAGLADQVGEYAAVAAREAVEVGAHLDAARQYKRALTHGESTGRERVELQIGFGYTAWMAGRSEPAVSVLTEAVAGAERLGDDALLARALDRLSVALWEVDRMAESREAQERAVAVIEHGDDDAALSRALSGLVSMLSVGIDPDAAIAEAPRALAQAEKAGSQEERIQIELSLALAHGIHGDPAAIELFDRLRVEALERGAHQAAMRTYVNECAVAAANRDHATVDRLVPEALALFEELQVLHPRDDVAGNFARSLLDRSRFDEAIEWALTAQTTPHRERGVAAAIEALARLRRGDPGLSDIPAEADVVPNDIYRYAMVMAAKAEAAWLRGDLDAAREHVRAGLGVEGVEQDSRALGDLALWAARCGEPVTPELERAPEPVRLELAGDWSAAIRAWEELGCDYDAALAALPADARAASRAAETLQRLGAATTARAFTRAREAAGASAPRGPRRSTLANPAGLTRREREVLDELASGATNAAIAAALHLSERTVAHHVSAVLRKLDMPTRTAAVAEAQRLGLLAKDGQEGAPR